MSNASVLHSVIQPKPAQQPSVVRSLTHSPVLLDEEVIGNDPEDLDALLAVLVENTPVAMAMFDQHMHYLLANRQWVADFGLQDAVPLLGRSQFEVFPHLHAGWRSVYDRALQGHIVRSENDITEAPDGGVMVFRWEVRPWRRESDGGVGGVMVTCEKFTPVGLVPEVAKEPAEAPAPIGPPAVVVNSLDAFLKCDLPVILLDLDGVIQQANDASIRLSLARGVREGVTHFWEAFGGEAEMTKLRQQTIEAVANALGSDGQATASIVVRDPGDPVSKTIHWAMSRLNGEENEMRVLLIGVTCVEPLPVPAKVAPIVPLNLHHSTAALEAAFQLEKRQVEEQLSATVQEVRLLQNLEQAYKRRELRQREVLDTMPCGLIVLDERGRPTFQNAHVRDLFGRELKAGDSVEDWLLQACLNDSHREEVARIWRESVWRRQLTRVVSLSTADGLLKDFEFRPAPLPNNGLLVTIHDVTESCRLEEMLRSTEAKFRVLLHEAPTAVVLTDPTGTIFEANAAAEALFGRPKTELRRTSVDDWLMHDSVHARRAELRHIATGASPRPAVPVQFKGSDAVVALKLAPICDADGRVHSAAHFFETKAESVPDRKASSEVEAPIAKAIELPKAQIPPPAWVSFLKADGQGRIRSWSAAAESLLGWTPAEAMHRPLHTFFRPSDATGFYTDLHECLGPRTQFEAKWVSFGRDGRREMASFLIRAEGTEGAVEFFVRSETASTVSMEAQSPSSGGVVSSSSRWPLADLDRERLLLTETHHRITNHLQLISSLLNLQGNSVEDETARGALRASQNRVRAIAALHQHLYQLALGQDVPFRQFVQDLVARLRDCYGIHADRVAVSIELEDFRVRDEWVMPIALILNEAVSNAFKHAFPNGVSGQLRIRLQLDATQGHLIIQDSGPGLVPGFDPARNPGLGLKVIGVFADQMDGGFSLKNIADSGLVFDLHFPITCVDN